MSPAIRTILAYSYHSSYQAACSVLTLGGPTLNSINLILLLPYVCKVFSPNRALTWTPQLASWTPLPAAPSAALPPGLAARSHWSSGCSPSGLQALFLPPAWKTKPKDCDFFTLNCSEHQNPTLCCIHQAFSLPVQTQPTDPNRACNRSMEEHSQVNPPLASAKRSATYTSDHKESWSKPNCFCPLIYKLCFKISSDIIKGLSLSQMDLSVSSFVKGRKQGPEKGHALHLHKTRAQTYPFLGSSWLLLSNEGGFKFCERREAAISRSELI